MTPKKKKSFILYAEDHRFIARLSAEQKADLLDAIFYHAQGKPPSALDPTTEMAFHFITAQIDRDAEKWEETCRRRAEAGRKGGLARARNAALHAAEANQANQAESVSDSEYESVSVSESVSESVADAECEADAVSDAVPPAVDAVRGYCRQRGNGIDAEKFCDYYAARGWRLGGAPMTDWRAAVRNWERSERASPAAQTAPASEPALADWEQDWLDEMRTRREQRGKD